MPTPRTEQLTQSVRNFSGKPAVRRTAIGLFAFIVLIGLFGYFALPGIIKSQAEQIITEKLHRKTSIGQVEVNPYAMRLTIHDMKLMEPEGDVVFVSFEKLLVNVSYKSLLRLAPVVEQVQLSTPYVHLVRKDANRTNIDDIIELINSQPPSPEPARFSVFNIEIDKGRIEVDDRPAHTKHEIADLKLGVPFISSLPSQVEVYVEPLLSANVNGSPLLLKGKAHPFADPLDAVVDLNLDDVDLTDYLKYVPGTPHFKVPSAKLDVHLTANFRQEKEKAPALLLSGNIKLKALQLNDQNDKSIVKLPELAITLNEAKVLTERFEIAKLAINGVEADITRNANGQFNFENLLTPPTPSKTAAANGAASKPAAPVAAAPTAPAAPTTTTEAAAPTPAATPTKAPAAFTFALAELDINNAALRYNDAQGERPVQASIEKFNLAVRKVEIDTGKKTVVVDEVSSNHAGFDLQQGKPRANAANAAVAKKSTPADSKTSGKAGDAPYTVDISKIAITNWSARLEDRSPPKAAITVIDPLTLSLQNLSTKANTRGQLDLKASVNKNGQLAVNGSVGMTPLHTDLALDFKSVDIMQLQPYFTDQVNILLTRADISGKGKLQIDQGKGDALVGGFKGDLTLGNLATIDKLSSNDFLRWKSLYFGGMDVRLSPFALSIDQVALSDFFARVIIDPTGRINLQDVKRSETVGQKSVTEENKPSGTNPPVASSKTVVLPPPTKTASEIPPIKIKKLSLQGGQIRFTDNFIKPNYTANLMKFGGVVSGLSSDPNSNANVDLKGQVNSAPLAIAGSINPLKGDLTMDLKAEVHGMELAPLSPYSGRYIGYGIEKGKLSFEVAYKVQDRVLSAQNRLILEQLTLGDKVEGSSAGNLPVNFALALLRDRNGVIDINLPIGGSLDDPQFSIGGIIVKVIVNVITKAVTAPFALLGSLFGGGEELSNLEFAVGRSNIDDAGETKLKNMAKMLSDRPALKLEITGRSDPETDREGLKQASIDRKVRALKLKDMVSHGQSGDMDSISITPQEYPALLKRVYSAEKFPKPRNMIGLQKDLPVDEMEKLMVTNTTVSDDDLTALANRRAQVVKDWLLQNGKVPEERIFLLASKSGAGAAKEGSANAKASRVDFSLK
ncbi:AsmA family protein [compost metagenome]